MPLAVPTFQVLYDAFKSEVQARNPALTDFEEGSNLDSLAGAAAVLADLVVRQDLSNFAAQFVDTASGDDLDALALDRFGLERKEATAASGYVTFTRDGTSGSEPIPAGTVLRATVDGVSVTFTTDSAIEIADGSTTISVLATCSTTGTTGNVAADTVTTIVDTLGDATIAVTNGERMVGGAAEETDNTFRDRIRRYFSTLRKGTVSALEAGAIGVGGVAYAAVDETHRMAEDGGYVLVLVADAEGYANAALVEAVETELENWRSAGIWVQVEGAERQDEELALELGVVVGADQGTIRAAVRASVLAYTDTLAPGATLYLSAVTHAAHGASGDIVYVSVSSPAADIAPDTEISIIRVGTSGLTLAFTEVA